MKKLAKCAGFALAVSLAAPGIGQRITPPSRQQGPQPSPQRSNPQPAATPQVAPPVQSTQAQPVMKPASAPRVSYQNGELTVVAENSSLSDTLNAIRSATGVRIEGANGGSDRVMAKIGPAPVRDVLLSLLEGSRFDFAMLGSESDPERVDRLVLSPRVAATATNVAAAPAQPVQQEPYASQPGSDDDDNEGFAEPAKPEATPAATPGQVKTPEQLLEDLKKIEADRAQQQQAQPNQPVDPNAARPQRPERPK